METVEAVKARLEQMLGSHRLIHSYNVAEEACRLAILYGADPDKAYYAGLCHDICKNMPDQEQLQWVKRSGIIMDDAFLEQPPIWHGFAAAQFLREELAVEDQDVLNAVRYHTTGRADMSVLEKVVFAADLTEPGRDYPDVETVRTLADKSLDQAVVYVLRYALGKLLVGSCPICRDSWEAYNWLILQEKRDNLLKKGEVI